MENKLE